MTRIAKNITPELDIVGIAQVQSLGAAGDLILNGNLAVNGVFTAIDSAQIIGVTSSGNDLGITFTVYGTDSRDVAISEVLIGTNGSTVPSTKYFKTVNRIATSGAVATSVSVGVTALCVSPWIQMNQAELIDIGLFVVLSTGAVMTWQIEHTPDDIQQNSDVVFNTFPHDDLSAKTTSEDGNYAFPATAYRMKVTAFTSGTATFTSWQAF